MEEGRPPPKTWSLSLFGLKLLEKLQLFTLLQTYLKLQEKQQLLTLLQSRVETSVGRLLETAEDLDGYQVGL